MEEKNKLTQEIKSSNELKNKLEAIKKDLSALEITSNKLKTFIGDKNQWSDILKTLSTVISSMKYTWIQNLESYPTYFEVEGFTLSKQNIIKLSESFPNGTIKEIRKMHNKESGNIILWSFKISFGYPKKQ